MRRVGWTIRVLRRHRGWRQVDVAQRAGVSQDSVSDLELGRVGRMTVRTVAAVLSALDAQLVLNVRWRGGALDRLLDERHAALAGAVVAMLRQRDWLVAVEVSFAHYGERGSIDILAWHPASATLLIVEIKSELASIEETLRRLDVKVRLAGQIAAERFGWQARTVSRLIVLPDESTARRRVVAQSQVLDVALPVRGRVLTRWLKAPAGTISGLLFLSPAPGARVGRVPVNRQRVRVQSPRTDGGRVRG